MDLLAPRPGAVHAHVRCSERDPLPRLAAASLERDRNRVAASVRMHVSGGAMSNVARYARRVGLLAWMAIAGLAVGGCHRWEPVTPAAAPERLGYVEARRADGSAVRLARARLSVDSLVGRRAGLLTTARVSVPRDSLTSLRRRRLDARRSVLAAGAMAIMAVIGFSVAAPWTPH